MKRWTHSHFVWLVLGATLLLTYQNCAPFKSIEDPHAKAAASAAEDQFFDYPYKSAPTYFVEAQLFKPQGMAEKFEELTIFVSIAPADGQAVALEYEVNLTDANGFPLCPTESGRLAAGTTSLRFNCTALSRTAEVYLSVGYGPIAATQHRHIRVYR
ncbi:MAG TPA: hypothetical protein PLZ57_07055 [Pseudobdellovibrionaceae bacterium]|nr:hypothetical protein [Pseudobdellovibrionaceae bacterium]